MAVTKGRTVEGAKSAKAASRPSKTSAKPSPKSKKPSAPSKSSQVKTKRSIGPQKAKKKVYTEKELGIPALNMITPVGVEKPKGKKKGKVFVDDQHSMMTILAMVNAEKEGQIESKMMKARQLEEIREARRLEAEARQEEKRSKLEETKKSLRKKRKPNHASVEDEDSTNTTPKSKKFHKRVSFG